LPLGWRVKIQKVFQLKLVSVPCAVPVESDANIESNLGPSALSNLSGMIVVPAVHLHGDAHRKFVLHLQPASGRDKSSRLAVDLWSLSPFVQVTATSWEHIKRCSARLSFINGHGNGQHRPVQELKLENQLQAIRDEFARACHRCRRANGGGKGQISFVDLPAGTTISKMIDECLGFTVIQTAHAKVLRHFVRAFRTLEITLQKSPWKRSTNMYRICSSFRDPKL
jgi:hypothetical protein